MLLGNEATWNTRLEPSDATSCLGIAVAQVSGVSKAVQPDHYRVLRYTACICQALSVVILLTGTYRFFPVRAAISGKGKRTSYWSLLVTGILVFVVAKNSSIFQIYHSVHQRNLWAMLDLAARREEYSEYYTREERLLRKPTGTI